MKQPFLVSIFGGQGPRNGDPRDSALVRGLHRLHLHDSESWVSASLTVQGTIITPNPIGAGRKPKVRQGFTDARGPGGRVCFLFLGDSGSTCSALIPSQGSVVLHGHEGRAVLSQPLTCVITNLQETRRSTATIHNLP